jgi:hypothetical protein
VQKLAHAAQSSFAELAFLDAKGGLLDNRIEMLTRMNNEAKVRRSTRPIVVGKAEVMRFEDIKVAQAAYAMKDVTKVKGKRGRKRKTAALEVDEPEPEVAQTIDVPVPWRAPVAKMI